MQFKDQFRVHTGASQPVTIGDLTVTPQFQALIVRLPGGGFVWNSTKGYSGGERWSGETVPDQRCHPHPSTVALRMLFRAFHGKFDQKFSAKGIKK